MKSLSIFIVFLLAGWCQAQSFDGMVKPGAYLSFEGKPIEVRISGQRESQVGELQRLVTLRNNDQLVGIEFTVNRSPRKVKPEQVESLKIDSRPYTLRMHVPTKQYVLIDSVTARGEATARMGKKSAQWVDLLSEAEFQNATLQSMNQAKKFRELLNDKRVNLVEGKSCILLTDFSGQSGNALLKTVDQIIPNLDKMFGVRPSDGYVTNGKVVLCAFQSRELFATLEKKAFQNENYGTYKVTVYFPNDTLVVNANDLESNTNLVWHLCWGCSGAYADRIHTNYRLPEWLRLSIMQTGADVLVPGVFKREQKMRRTTDLLKSSGSMNGLLEATELIGDRHFLAKHFGQFLATKNKAAYPEFLLEMKTGIPMEDAIKNTYGDTLNEIIVAFGRSFGVNQLKP